MRTSWGFKGKGEGSFGSPGLRTPRHLPIGTARCRLMLTTLHNVLKLNEAVLRVCDLQSLFSCVQTLEQLWADKSCTASQFECGSMVESGGSKAFLSMLLMVSPTR